jgi:hypothetical protein
LAGEFWDVGNGVLSVHLLEDEPEYLVLFTDRAQERDVLSISFDQTALRQAFDRF